MRENGQLIAAAAQAKGKVSEIELQIIQIDQDVSSEVANELRDIDSKIGELVERKLTAEDQLRRIDIRAPQDGKFDFFKLHDHCYECGFTIYPGKMFGLETFRLCNLGVITHKDIEDFFVVAKEAFRKMGYTLPIK